MIEQKHEELLNREIDGQNSPEESAALRKLIESTPEVRTRYEALVRLARVLERVKAVAPPPGLSDQVLRAIRERGRAVEARRPAWLDTLKAAFARQPALRFSTTFAGGLALGVLLAFLLTQSPLHHLDETALSGAMLPESRLGRLETLAREPIGAAGVHGEASVRLAPGRVVADIRLESPATVLLSLEFDGKILIPLAFEQSGSGRDVALGSSSLSLEHSGTGRYLLVLETRGTARSPLKLRLGSGPGSLERTLQTWREDS